MHHPDRVLLTVALGVGAVSACGDTAPLTPRQAPAQRTPAMRAGEASPAPPAFAVTTLPSLGGSFSQGSAINAGHWVAGFSNLPGDTTQHATLWQNGALVDLGTLGGPNSQVQWPGLNDAGVVVGIAELAATDSLHEAWSCAAFFPTVTHHVCRGFVWQGGHMTALPTFGGTHGFATGVNNRAQVVGWAETVVHDPTCHAPQVLQFRAARWDPGQGSPTQLRPLPGDSTSAATGINDAGQAVGISGTCDVAVGDSSAIHAVLWGADGRVTDIGNLGGDAWHTPMAINANGDVVGFSNPRGVRGHAFVPHAFLRTRAHGMQDLGVLKGDTLSQALGINARRQVVGTSCTAAFRCRAFLWQDGVLWDLTALVRPGFAGTLTSAQAITDAGVITGSLIDPKTRKTLAFVATPMPGHP